MLAGTPVACAEPDEPAPSADKSTSPSDPEAAGGSEEPRDPPEPASSGQEPRAPSSSNGFHLDQPDIEYEPDRRDDRPRRSRPIEIVLRSTPPGAMAAVDGVAIGPTPTLWEGTADGRAREFTFVLPGHAIARYRFVPTQSGVVHGSLSVLKSPTDAGPADEGQ
jgi:hypothetical protein